MLLGLMALLTVMIAASLPRLEFQPGMPLPRLQQGHFVAGAGEEETQFISISASRFVLGFMALVLVVATLYSAYQLLKSGDWTVLLDVLRYVLIVSIGVGCLVFLIMLLPDSGSYEEGQIVLPTAQPLVPATAPLGSTPPALLWLVGVGLLVTSVLVVVWVLKPARQQSPIDLVGQEAEKARQALRTGAGLREVILHCYLQMSLALKQEQGLERKDFMTTGEFEQLLESAGLPHEPIHQLTGLFEAVRYGNWQPNAADEQTAIRSLEAIMDYSRTARGVS